MTEYKCSVPLWQLTCRDEILESKELKLIPADWLMREKLKTMNWEWERGQASAPGSKTAAQAAEADGPEGLSHGYRWGKI